MRHFSTEKNPHFHFLCCSSQRSLKQVSSSRRIQMSPKPERFYRHSLHTITTSLQLCFQPPPCDYLKPMNSLEEPSECMHPFVGQDLPDSHSARTRPMLGTVLYCEILGTAATDGVSPLLRGVATIFFLLLIF